MERESRRAVIDKTYFCRPIGAKANRVSDAVFDGRERSGKVVYIYVYILYIYVLYTFI